MTREILGALEEGAMDALRTYAVLIMAPFAVTKSLVARAKRASAKCTPDGRTGSSEADRNRR
jgi:hypothetical protein